MFPDVPEFQFIDKLLKNAVPLKEDSPKVRSWLGVGDDCAIFDGWLATKDLSVEKTHFRLDWSTPEQAVEKHIVSNVSDISSMGGVPRIAFLGLCLNRNWPEEIRNRVRDAFAQGFAKRGITLLGGDTVSGDVGMFSTTLLGVLAGKEPLLRSNVKSGDSLYVNGTLGKSGAGLWLLMNHPEDASSFPGLVQYHLDPKINESAGAALVGLGTYGACMDISDGLSSELNHLAISSRANLLIEENALPLDPEMVQMCKKYGLDPLEFALNGGEEYQLLFSSSVSDSIFESENKNLGKVYRIGSALNEGEAPKVEMRCLDGEDRPVLPRAWSHI